MFINACSMQSVCRKLCGVHCENLHPFFQYKLLKSGECRHNAGFKAPGKHCTSAGGWSLGFPCAELNTFLFGHRPVRTSMAIGLLMMAERFAWKWSQKALVWLILGITRYRSCNIICTISGSSKYWKARRSHPSNLDWPSFCEIALAPSQQLMKSEEKKFNKAIKNGQVSWLLKGPGVKFFTPWIWLANQHHDAIPKNQTNFWTLLIPSHPCFASIFSRQWLLIFANPKPVYRSSL